MSNFGRSPLEGLRRAGKIGPVIDDRDQLNGLIVIRDCMLPKEIYSCLRDLRARDHRKGGR